MPFAAILFITLIGTPPEYEWSSVKLPSDLITPSMKGVDFAFSKDGNHMVVENAGHIALYEGDGFRKQHVFPVDVELIRNVGFLDGEHLILGSLNKLTVVRTSDAKVIKQHRFSEIGPTAVLPSGLVVGTVSPAGAPIESCRNAVISPNKGSVVRNCGNGASAGDRLLVITHSRLVAVDPSGTRFAGGNYGLLWISDIYTQQTREVAAGGTPGVGFFHVCFDPSGRYLLAAFEQCEIMVIDLLIPHIQPVDWLRGMPQYVGSFGEGKHCCRGLGFIGDRWFWFSDGRDLFFCSWPGLKVIGRVTPSGSKVVQDQIWQGTRDGRVLAGIDGSGTLRIGRLKSQGK